MRLTTFILAGCLSNLAIADTTMVYELTDKDGIQSEHTYSIDGRWIRIDRSADKGSKILLMDTGYMIMHVVDKKNKTYSAFGYSPIHQTQGLNKKHQQAMHYRDFNNNKKRFEKKYDTGLKPGAKKENVAGVRCRVVNELTKGKERKLIAEHCMADATAFGMTPLELISMSRLIEFSRDNTDPDWIAMQSKERFITADSKSPTGKSAFTLKSISHQRLPNDHFFIPKDYKALEAQENYDGLLTGNKN